MCAKIGTKGDKERYNFFIKLSERDQIFQNVVNFIGQFSSKAHYKKAIVGLLTQNLGSQSLIELGFTYDYVKRARQALATSPLPDFFTQRCPAGSEREYIPATEVAGICSWAKTAIHGKSGSNHER